ncbi:MAG: ABC transporter permease [Marinilabiliaceae bacterium]|nr:ABC transporter permease [Marinilabiliaceae bacterium]
MNLELFIANKIRYSGVTGKKLSGPVIKVATIGVAIGMVVMIMAVAIGLGFKKEVREKVIGFGSHVQVMSYDYNLSYEVNPIPFDSSLLKSIASVDGVVHVQRFISKPGIIKVNDEVHGLVLKGVGDDYNWSFFENILIEGEVISFENDSVLSNDILISSSVAQMLGLKVGDAVPMYFIQNNLRGRKFKVCGIFDSSLPELDKVFALVDFRQVQKLNNWESHQIAGYELLINDFKSIDDITFEVQRISSSYINPDGIMLRTRSIKMVQPQLFSWLDLLDTNIVVILILITLVAGFNMISGLLILILERTNMIGVLKAVGAPNVMLRKVFVYVAMFIVVRGLIWGNFIGVGLCLIQKYTGLIELDPSNYYLSHVPILLESVDLILLNIVAFVVTSVMLIFPSLIIARISPVKAIRFD